MLQTTILTIRRRGAAELTFPALSLAQGSRALLLGPSGSGKTTWLSTIAGLLPPDEGAVNYEGQDIYKLPVRRRDRWRGQHCGFVFQTLHLIPALTLRQNIVIAASLAGLRPEKARIDALLEKLNLADKAHRKPAALSQGEQQRTAIARAVLNRPAIIMADEPTSALDDANAQAVMDLLESCAAESNAALLIATHDTRLQDRFSNIITIASAKGTAA